ncbi:MAG: DNA mismatch repair endonuclease MutL [Lachnospiraceae bacterium]|jgi:DNA mismatch repair protein MutL|nr:DNA mismatch repair endonuclease MutL [Lachnospiraceae bacterium]
MSIALLDQLTIDQIAAGEVIERPASVVKELLENAIDARATAITVEIKDGGLSLIRVTDNGSGIEPEEVGLAFLRHSTSKIRDARDLEKVASLGFRGEALSSIASVAQVELITKTPRALAGIRYRIDGGAQVGLEEVGAPDGTTFLVRNLFYNTPARRKFLKSAQAEAGHIATAMERVALSRPDISFRLIQNNQTRLHTTGNGNVRDLIYAIYGKETAGNLLEVKFGDFHVGGVRFGGKPETGGLGGEQDGLLGGTGSGADSGLNDSFAERGESKELPIGVGSGADSGLNDRFAERSVRKGSYDGGWGSGLWESSFIGDFARISGFIGAPAAARANRNAENYFVNGRFIRSPLLFRAIEDGFKHVLMQHKFPFCVLYLEIAPQLLDVNVHPAKLEVRFREEQSVYAAVNAAVKNALSRRELIPAVKMGEGGGQLQGGASYHGDRTGIDRFGENTAGGTNPKDENIGAGGVGRSGYLRPPEPFEKNRLRGMGLTEALGDDARPAYGGNGTSYPTGNHGTVTGGATYPAGNHGTVAGRASYLTGNHDTVAGGATYPTGNHGTVAIGAGIIAEADAIYQASVPSGTSDKSVSQPDFFQEEFLGEGARNRHKLIGQVFDTYWLVEYAQQLYIVDQHAAHEKVLYEKNLELFAKKEVVSQRVDPPVIITLDSASQTALEAHKAAFESTGFEIEHYGGREYAIFAVPDNLYDVATKELLTEMLDDLAENPVGRPADGRGGAGGAAQTLTTLLDDKLALLSCKAAVKGNQKLSHEEMDALMGQLLGLKNPYTCPHGRPTIISMSRYELEKKFKRIV